jgi:hypothetical protein
VLEKVLGVSTKRSGSYLVTKPSPAGVDADGTSYPLRYPSLMSVGLTYSLWFRKVLPT